MTELTLRPVTIEDTDILLEWRNDIQTRSASHNSEEVSRETHLEWMTRSLADENRKIFIAEENGELVGTIRADWDNSIYELSWTVAPYKRGKGVCKRMVAILASRITNPIRAEIKAGNKASISIAEHAGMKYDRTEGEVLHFARGSLK